MKNISSGTAASQFVQFLCMPPGGQQGKLKNRKL